MTSAEKAARKAKLRQWRAAEHAAARSRYPLPSEVLQRFFDQVEGLRAIHGCHHDLRHTEQVMERLALAPADRVRLRAWCAEHGGFCDCEVVANTWMHWRETRED